MEAALTNPSGRMTLGSSVVRIGSAQDNHVVINDPNVSPHHAEIRPEGQEERLHTIIDLGGTTGTFVNEQRLDDNVPLLLHPNDMIRIGDAIFNYEVMDIPQTAAPPVDTSQVNTTTYSPTTYPPAAFAPPPTGAMAPLSPPGFALPTYTLASLREKESRGKILLALAITALIILVVALIFGSFHSPSKTLDTYCSALQNQDYQTAYSQLSPGQQGLYSSEAAFASSQGQHRIISCSSNAVYVTGNTATAILSILTSSSSNPSISAVILVQDSSFNWKIDGYKRS